jgi:hypothetical protein
MEMETSVRRRFPGSASIKPVPAYIDIDRFVKGLVSADQSGNSLNNKLSATFPARLASLTDSKRTFERSTGLVLPAR